MDNVDFKISLKDALHVCVVTFKQKIFKKVLHVRRNIRTFVN
jgi:hypothetical protein